MKITVTAAMLKNAKAVLRDALPSAGASNRVEALARGLGYRTYAAMLADVGTGAIEREVQPDAFQAYLSKDGDVPSAGHHLTQFAISEGTKRLKWGRLSTAVTEASAYHNFVVYPDDGVEVSSSTLARVEEAYACVRADARAFDAVAFADAEAMVEKIEQGRWRVFAIAREALPWLEE